MTLVAPVTAETKIQPTDAFFSAAEARSDRWRQLNAAAGAWASAPQDGAVFRQQATRLLEDIAPIEDYWSYPGPRLMRSLRESLEAQDAPSFARLTHKIGRALLSNSYRHDAAAWDPLQEAQLQTGNALPPDADGNGLHKPCFDVLIVTPSDPAQWDEGRRQIERLRRREDPFTYHVVQVGSFEDAAVAVALNHTIQAVVIYDGFPFSSRHNAPLLHDHLTRYVKLDSGSVVSNGAGFHRPLHRGPRGER
jgi:arginine decarboxylase